MSQRVLCKFFANGACLKGEHCEYSHDWKAPPNNICTFYQQGLCAYGSRCRYDHVRPSRSPASSSPTPPTSSLVIKEKKSLSTSSLVIPKESEEEESTSSHAIPSSSNASSSNADASGNGVMCSYAAAGECPKGEKCKQVHGDLCGGCGKRCLHPTRVEEREEHERVCRKRQEHLKALQQSQEMECSVCLERVLSKPTVAERKFGLMSECDHPFCISCIRNWRGSSPASALDTKRTCPICRKLSYFVVPSLIWYSSHLHKQEIVDAYKSKLKSIHCKHFDFGNATCPFGTSCFYKHGYRDGRVEEVDLRHLGNEDGHTVIAKNIRLSDFISQMHIR